MAWSSFHFRCSWHLHLKTQFQHLCSRRSESNSQSFLLILSGNTLLMEPPCDRDVSSPAPSSCRPQLRWLSRFTSLCCGVWGIFLQTSRAWSRISQCTRTAAGSGPGLRPVITEQMVRLRANASREFKCKVMVNGKVLPKHPVFLEPREEMTLFKKMRNDDWNSVQCLSQQCQGYNSYVFQAFLS